MPYKGKSPLQHAVTNTNLDALGVLAAWPSTDWRLRCPPEAGGHTLFTYVCRLIIDGAGVAEQDARLRECARFLLGLRGPEGQPVFGPMDMLAQAAEGTGPQPPELRSFTLYWALKAGLVDEIRAWVASGAIHDWTFTARVVDGQTYFAALVGTESCRSQRKLHDRSKACIASLAGHKACVPGTVSLDDRQMSHLQRVCEAGLHLTVAAWRNRSLLTNKVVQLSDSEHRTAFHHACSAFRSQIMNSESAQPVIEAGGRACAVLLVQTAWVEPGAADDRQLSHLFWACWIGLPEAVAHWMEQWPQALGVCINSQDNDGETPFGAACDMVINGHNQGQRQACKACALTLAQHPSFDPCALSDTDHTQFAWACHAGLAGLVQGWLASGRVGQDTVQHQNDVGDTACHAACVTCQAGTAQDVEQEVAAGARACAVALLMTSWVEPGTLDDIDETPLLVACSCGLTEAVAYWMVHAYQALGQCINARHNRGGTPFGAACSVSVHGGHAAMRAAGKACALALAEHPPFDPCAPSSQGVRQFTQACYAGLDGLVQGWLASGRVGQDTVQSQGPDGTTAFHQACNMNIAHKDDQDQSVAAGTRACAVALVKTGWAQPCTTDVRGHSSLHWACWIGLPEAVEYWMRECPGAVAGCINAPDNAKGLNRTTPFGLASCQATEMQDPRHVEGCTACAAALVKHPAFDPSARSFCGLTHFVWACRMGLVGLMS